MAEIGFCESCGAKHEIESVESCMCGGDLKPVSQMDDAEERKYRKEWSQLATQVGE